MFTYQLRRRLLVFKGGTIPEFPNEATIRYTFEPKQAFGTEPGGGRTMLANSVPTPRIHFSLCTGRASAENSKPLGPLDVEINLKDQRLRVDGNKVTQWQRFESARELEQEIVSMYYVLPTLLAVRFADPPYIELVEGEVGGHHFSWELQNFEEHFQLSSAKQQERLFIAAWDDMEVIAPLERRRLTAAIGYFHTACRLRRESHTPGEFLAEALLNFCKVLEILFPGNRDATRAGLRAVGISDEAIERDFIPVMLLRSTFDVAHPQLALMTETQIETLHRYSDRAETLFQELLQVVLMKARAGVFSVAPFDGARLSATETTTLDKLRQRLDEADKRGAGTGKWAIRIRRGAGRATDGEAEGNS